MKICFRCNTEKPLNKFYAHPRMRDGHLNKCKDCTKADSRDNHRLHSSDQAWLEKQRERGRKKYHRLYASGRQWVWVDQPAELKRWARRAFSNAVRDGRIKKPTFCTACSRTTPSRLLHGHHADYRKPFDVLWLCAMCHRHEHLTAPRQKAAA